MVRTITYSLRAGAADSGDYYITIAAFVDAWLADTLPSLADLVDGYRPGQGERSPACCAFDLLVLGILLREHGREAARLPGRAEALLRRLLAVQERWPRLEPAVKWGRGLVYRLARLRGGRGDEPGPDALLAWLSATGEATAAARLSGWVAHFRSCGREAEVVERLLRLADEFAADSLVALGKYTERVGAFLAEDAPRHRWRYDAALLNRSRLEYHLGMVGNEILNREYRREFLATDKKIVILPPCMRARPEEECKAVATPLGGRCAACTPSCRIHQVTKLGEKHGFAVFMIPEELRVFGGAGSAGGSMGVVGVACVLTNWTGGWDAERIGLPVQGVLLDYVGCKYHWDEEGFPTDMSLHQLMKVLGVNRKE